MAPHRGYLAVVLVAVIVMSCAPGGCARGVSDPPLLPVAHWRAVFDAGAAVNDVESERLSRSDDSADFYPLAYSIDELGSMYEATGDLAYARKALHFTRNMIDSARPSSSLATSTFHDGYLGWVSPSEGGDEVPLYESYVWRHVTRLLRLLRSDVDTAPPDVRDAEASTSTSIANVPTWRHTGR